MFQDLLAIIEDLIFRTFTGKVEVLEKNNSDTGKPLIYVVRGSGSLLDGIAMKVITQKDLSFLADAQHIQYPVVNFFLRLMRVLPLYHITKSDGRKSVQKNKVSFDKSRDILMENGSLVIFQNDKTDLNHIQNYARKGAARIAFNAEEVFDFKLDVQIVPVIFQYQKQNDHKSFTISFKNPIAIKNYEGLHKQSASKALRSLTNTINQSLGFSHSSYPSEEPQFPPYYSLV